MSRSFPLASIISSVRLRLILAVVIAVTVHLACGPKPSPTPKPAPATGLPAPFDLQAKAADGRAMLTWSVNRNDRVPISGYNIYLSEISRIGDTLAWKSAPHEPYNDFPYPGDTDGNINSESFPIEDLKDGHSYMALVRTLGPGGALSEPSNIVIFRPLGEGEFMIGVDHQAENGGFNFERGISVPGQDPRSDIYIYATRDRVGLSSPSRLGAGLRKTEFLAISENVAPLETIPITQGDIITLKTRRGLATLEIEEILGSYPKISAGISYKFQPED